MGDIFTNKTVTDVLCEYDCTLGLDISRNSTGVALYQNGVLRLYRISLDSKYDKGNTMWEAEMKKEFKEALTTLVKGKKFDIVVIENTINGCNAITNKELSLLNTVFDDLVIDGVCSVKKENIVRTLPNVWRKELKNLAGNVKATNTKELVEKLLQRLGYLFVIEHSDDSDKLKKEQGYYDICDATGMLISYMYKRGGNNNEK